MTLAKKNLQQINNMRNPISLGEANRYHWLSTFCAWLNENHFCLAHAQHCGWTVCTRLFSFQTSGVDVFLASS